MRMMEMLHLVKDGGTPNVNGNYSSRLSNDQSAFHDIAKTYGTDRNPVGYIKYYKGKYIR